MEPNNDVITQTFEKVLPKWTPYIVAIGYFVQILGRVFYQLKTNGGLSGLWESLMYGKHDANKNATGNNKSS